MNIELVDLYQSTSSTCFVRVLFRLTRMRDFINQGKGGHNKDTSHFTQKLKVLLNNFSSLLLNIHSRKICSSMAREFHCFQRFLLELVDEFQTWMCLLTDLLGTHYWAIPELNAAIASSRRLGSYDVFLSFLAFAHTIRCFYTIIQMDHFVR